MKKKLLILASIAPLFAFGQEATTFVGEGVAVKVKPETLYYNKGDFKVKVASTNQGKVSNEGNVKVEGDFTVSDDGKGFVNEFTNGKSYGQLIVENDKTVTGKIKGKYEFVPGFAYHPLAIPYSGYTAGDLAKDLAKNTSDAFVGYTPGRGGFSVYDGARYKNLVWSWDSENYVSDNKSATDVLNPVVYHEVNTLSSVYASPLGVKELVGKPNNGNVNFNVNLFKQSITNIGINKYGEAYGTYVYDITMGNFSGWNQNIKKGAIPVSNTSGFGNSQIFAANPYTSNIDLSKMTGFSNVAAVLQFSGNSYERKDGSAGVAYGTPKLWTSDGGGVAASKIVRPYHAFILKANPALNNVQLGFVDAMKQFDGTAPYYDTSGEIQTSSVNNSDTKPPFYQVNIQMYDKRDHMAQEFFVAASSVFQPEGKGKGIEIFIDAFLPDDAIGLYTLQEKAEGGYLESTQHQKLALNGINDQFIGKEVAVKFQAKGKRTFTLKSVLNDDLKNSGYKFYFEDKKLDVTKEITSDFEYTFTEENTTQDRFAIYWRATPKTMSVSDVNTSQTIVYKSGDEHKVKFSEVLNRADVYVYNLFGQLISSEKSINTDRDYILPYLAKSNVYIVKVVGDNGEVTTKKIIK